MAARLNSIHMNLVHMLAGRINQFSREARCSIAELGCAQSIVSIVSANIVISTVNISNIGAVLIIVGEVHAGFCLQQRVDIGTILQNFDVGLGSIVHEVNTSTCRGSLSVDSGSLINILGGSQIVFLVSSSASKIQSLVQIALLDLHNKGAFHNREFGYGDSIANVPIMTIGDADCGTIIITAGNLKLDVAVGIVVGIGFTAHSNSSNRNGCGIAGDLHEITAESSTAGAIVKGNRVAASNRNLKLGSALNGNGIIFICGSNERRHIDSTSRSIVRSNNRNSHSLASSNAICDDRLAFIGSALIAALIYKNIVVQVRGRMLNIQNTILISGQGVPVAI